MSIQEFSLDNELDQEQRVVEADIRFPKLSEIKKPDIDLEPLRNVAEQALITTLGLGVLAVRGLSKAVTAAYEAGQQAASDPESITHKIVDWMHKTEKEVQTDPSPTRRISVSVLPISDYDSLPQAELLTQIATLDAAQTEILIAYERDHRNREQVMAALEAHTEQGAD